MDVADLRRKIIVAAEVDGYEFDDKCAKIDDTPPVSYSRVGLQSGQKYPNTEKQYRVAFNNLVHMYGLDVLYSESQIAEIAKKAVRNIGPALREFGLSEEAKVPLMKVNLFDTWFFCGKFTYLFFSMSLLKITDDSGSMAGERYRIQRDTVARLAPIATRVSGNSVYLRFINEEHDDQGQFDNLNASNIAATIDSVQVGGGTRIGTTLAQKIVDPLLAKMNSLKGLEKPVVITIITDGEVSRNHTWESVWMGDKRVFLFLRINSDISAIALWRTER